MSGVSGSSKFSEGVALWPQPLRDMLGAADEGGSQSAQGQMPGMPNRFDHSREWLPEKLQTYRYGVALLAPHSLLTHISLRTVPAQFGNCNKS